MRPHGTRARYVADGCPCADCRAANNAYARYQQKRKRLEPIGERVGGRWAPPFVDAGPVVDRLLEFRELGVGYKRVAQLAGVSKTALAQLLAGRRSRCRRVTAAAVLSLPVKADVAPGQLVDAAETWRLIRRILHDTRWTKARLAGELGQRRALQLGRHQVTRRNADAVEALAYRLCVDL